MVGYQNFPHLEKTMFLLKLSILVFDFKYSMLVDTSYVTILGIFHEVGKVVTLFGFCDITTNGLMFNVHN